MNATDFISSRRRNEHTRNNETLTAHDTNNLQGTESLESHLSSTMNEEQQFADKDCAGDTDNNGKTYLSSLNDPCSSIVSHIVQTILECNSLEGRRESHDDKTADNEGDCQVFLNSGFSAKHDSDLKQKRGDGDKVP